MSENKIAIATAYYQAMSSKNLPLLETYLHPEVRLISPMAEVMGKEAVLNSVKHFCAFFNTLTIRERFAAGDQAMIVYDLDFPLPIGKVHAAVLISFEGNLISRFELFYDARPFEKKRDEIFN